MSKVLRVTISQLWFGQNCQNRLHFEYTNDANPAYLEDVATGIETGWIPMVRPATNNDVTFFSIKVDDLTNGPSGPQFTKTISIPGSGGDDAASPLGLAFVLKLQTGLSGRRNRGRYYACGQSPGHCTRGLLNASGISRWDNPIVNLKANFVLGGANQQDYHLVISSGTHGLDQLRIVKDIQLRTTPGSMRRRMVGVGS